MTGWLDGRSYSFHSVSGEVPLSRHEVLDKTNQLVHCYVRYLCEESMDEAGLEDAPWFCYIPSRPSTSRYSRRR